MECAGIAAIEVKNFEALPSHPRRHSTRTLFENRKADIQAHMAKQKSRLQVLTDLGAQYKKMKNKARKMLKIKKELATKVIKPSTLKAYKFLWTQMETFVKNSGDKLMNEVNFFFLLNKLVAEGKSGGYIASFKHALSFAQKLELEWAGSSDWLETSLNKMACKGAEAKNTARKDTGSITQSKLKELTDQTPAVEIRRALFMAWDAGLRISELLNLSPTDMPEPNLLIIRNNKATRATSKQSKATTIVVSNTFTKCFRDQVWSQTCKKNSPNSLWAGSGVHYAAIADQIKRTSASWDQGQRWSAHSLRHGAADRINKRAAEEARTKLRMHKKTFAHYSKQNGKQ